MQLNQQTDFALRALMLLAQEEKNNSPRLLTIREISEFHRISRNHMMKVINTLVEQNFVEAKRGQNGGLKLNRPSNEIRVGDVVRALENNWNLVECFSPERQNCQLLPSCQLKYLFHRALNAFFEELDQCTLADISIRIEPLIPKTASKGT
ncbi:Rrf2 family transcriptional regulator [Halothiobacillus neapolitanus]|uniref:Transcriptional regulator, BadM/Rrf2 family n=1 Tax=Halothiobacillus neapolitanus (strain ATCC 23641 / DSM 15147 / CIP 104769 / NCIMB 8539 / c2) TaxID=555778 RepID=D0KZ99_HALNC|nr:Rrf2 family transcriptional regulator [Halothiobacillus neapolitanus]ACX95772.1 transcriptional regulator, BadM/Rrf2 family [Halothiobacillus neapolitanus c2]TDN66079.1 BadM/Rrf2 family transcriptional regulator [Halothiobacillus neapolitanus]